MAGNSRPPKYVSFEERLTVNMWEAQRQVERVTLYLQEPRHIEDIIGEMDSRLDCIDECVARRKSSERLRTASVAIIMCLHLGVDPPDAPSRKDAASRLVSWVDPYKCGAHRAAREIAENTQKAYEKWQPKSNSRTRYKYCTDPPFDEVRKVATNLRRVSGNDRVLFHYNGHGVPKPTDNGEIWVFNKSFTQYIPLSIFDLQGWLDYPTIYIWETHSAETILNNYRRFGEDQKLSWQNRFDKWQEEQPNLPPISTDMADELQAEAMGFPEKFPRYNDCIHLAACSTGQYLPMSDPLLPADLFTSCLTTPIRTSLAFHLSQSEHRDEYPPNILDQIPGNLAERRTVLGELNWIFTAITDTIAFSSISREVFQKLFRQDLLLATLFRSFLLSQRVMGKFGVTPVSQPALPDTSAHELWRCWDQTMDMILDYVRDLIFVRDTGNALFCGKDVIMRSNVFPFLTLIDYDRVINNNECHQQHNPFFTEQLQAFELWLDYGIDEGLPPLQLPMVLQVLLSQAHRVRALRLLARFLDFGRWSIGYSLAVGIFPYVLKLLQSNISDLKISLAFIWAKILAVDPTCQIELFNECVDESASNQSPQQPQSSAALKPSPMFANHPPTTQSALEMSALHQQTGRYPTQNQAVEMQIHYAQQQAQHQQRQVESAGQHSPNPQRQVVVPKPAGIMKQPGQQPEKKTMLRFQYFLNLLSDPDIKPKQKTVAAFVLAQLTCNNFKLAQKELTAKGYLAMCIELLCDDEARAVKLLKLWILVGMGRLWSDYDQARWQGIRLMAHDKVLTELSDESAEVRAAAVFAIGSLLKNSSRTNEHASAVEENLTDELCNTCVFDSSVIVREELIVALQWFVFDFEKRFIKLLIDLLKQVKFELPDIQGEAEPNEEGLDIAAQIPKTQKPRGQNEPVINRKKQSTSVFPTAVEEVVTEDETGVCYMTEKKATTVEKSGQKYRERAMIQIRYLEGKTFNEGVARTWLALLRLSLDPMERVARMAQKIVKRVEQGVPEMQASIDNTMAHLAMKTNVRKASAALVTMPKKPVGPSEEVSLLAEQIQKNLELERATGGEKADIDFTELNRIQDEKNRNKDLYRRQKDESRVKFQVGSPFDPKNRQPNALSPGSSCTDDTQSSDLFTKDEESEEDCDGSLSGTEGKQESLQSRPGLRQISDSSSYGMNITPQGPFKKHEFLEIATKEFTPKRGIAAAGNFSKPGDSKSLRKIIENPIVATEFVDWCKKVFVEPILHVITLDDVKSECEDNSEDEFMPRKFREKIKAKQLIERKQFEEKRERDRKDGKKEKNQEDLVVTTTTISDWALHAMEGMVQSAEMEGKNFKSNHYDHCLWQAKLTHPAKCLITSKLRRCMYASDGQTMTIIRQDKDYREFRRFDLTDSNPFCPTTVSQLILINEVSREMILACSPSGLVRIWDPYFYTYSDDFQKPAELVSAGFPLQSQMTLGSQTNHCLFDWNQPNGKLLCTGNRSVRIWDAHCEKVCQDIPYSPGSMQSSGPSAKLSRSTFPTALSGNLDDEGNIVCVGYQDGRVDYFDIRMKYPKAAKVHLAPALGNHFEKVSPGIMYLKVNRKGPDCEMFAGNRDGCIYKLELRMFKEASPSIVTPWKPGRHRCMTVHDDSRILASASGSKLAIYDVSRNEQMAMIEPPSEAELLRNRQGSTATFGLFGSQRKMSAMTAMDEYIPSDMKPNVISLTMHQMRLLTVAGYDDNTVRVYGSTTPGLTGHYEQVSSRTKSVD